MWVKRLLLVLGLILVSGLVGWLMEGVGPRRPPSEEELRHDPDYYMEKFTVTAMNSAGQPRYRLDGDHMQHYPDDDTTELTKPHIEIYAEAAPPWYIDAERGWVSADGELVLLLGGVLARQEDTAAKRTTTLTSDELRIRPNDEYAETDKPVTLKSGPNIVEAIGMRAYIREGRLQLLSNARGKYEPARH